MLDREKTDVLIHYDTMFREDWRSLTKMRAIISTVYVGMQTSIIGWVLGEDKVLAESNFSIVYLSCIISIIGVISIFFCSNSINKTKIKIVKIEEALLLFEKSVYMETRILNSQDKEWGKDKKISRTAIASLLVGPIFPAILFLIKLKYCS